MANSLINHFRIPCNFQNFQQKIKEIVETYH
jgi:hypothetical protein